MKAIPPFHHVREEQHEKVVGGKAFFISFILQCKENFRIIKNVKSKQKETQAHKVPQSPSSCFGRRQDESAFKVILIVKDPGSHSNPTGAESLDQRRDGQRKR